MTKMSNIITTINIYIHLCHIFHILILFNNNNKQYNHLNTNQTFKIKIQPLNIKFQLPI